MIDNIKELVKRLTAYRTLLLRADGDRDLGFQSNITTNASMALADELKVAADALEAMAGEVAELSQHARLLRAAEATQANRAEVAESERDRMKAALEVPEVWSMEERDGLADVWREASRKHGHYETLFAIAAWLLRNRARKALGGDAS